MKKVALFCNSDKPDAIKYASYSAGKLIEIGAECFATMDLIESFSKEVRKFIKPYPIEEFERIADVVISFGGDGTMLSAGRLLMKSEIPIMGVNVGKLGFLAEFSVEELDRSLDDLMKGNYRLIERSVIETTLNNEIIYAINDLVIEKKNSSRIITIKVYTNDHHIGDYRVDGLIVTTPTGSTAYSLSCGGPVIAPSTQVIGITPISPHTMTLRPLVIPDTSEIKLCVHSPTNESNLVADGQVTRTLNNKESIVIRRSEANVKLIKPLESSYYDVLRRKLLWATNVVGNEAKLKK